MVPSLSLPKLSREKVDLTYYIAHAPLEHAWEST